jgi:hypothetical protein
VANWSDNRGDPHKAGAAAGETHRRNAEARRLAASPTEQLALTENQGAASLTLGELKSVAQESVALGLLSSRRCARRGFQGAELEELTRLITAWKILATDASDAEIERRVNERLAEELAKAEDRARGLASRE